MNLRMSRSGFTLIEVMIVVIIIAALAGMVLPKLIPASESAKRNIAKGDIASISTALKLYRLHNNRYPTTEEGLGILLKASTSRDWEGAYLERAADDPWKRKYEYRYPSSQGAEFDIWSQGPKTETAEDDVTSWSQQ